jgi:hypothetical protein
MVLDVKSVDRLLGTLDQYYPVPRAVGGRRIVVDLLMRRRRQTGGPRSACHTQCRSEKGPASRISLTAT